ncbi:MAG: Ldh family oxidoreductase [Candidatus Adiutrix sp.]|jgi:LDH2 family malate/lactate/ureidoglycolate dehydrogenase|nr:Ldh family oxidoreductase [Candidatus Adiutrix sp.]
MSSHFAYDALLAHTKDILAKGYGYSEEEARITAWVLTEADARGIPSHGVSRLAFYRKNLSQGHARPGAEPEVVWRTPCSLVVDGHDGVGCYIADWSVREMLELAKSSGAAYCAVRNSNHYGIAGLWAEEIARQDMIGMAFTNTYIAGIPTFGRRRILGTNPIAVGLPEASGRVFLLDMATTTVAHGKVELYDRRRKPMPLGWAIDENGRSVTDATAFEKVFYGSKFGGHLYLGGEGEEIGGHKGFGLGLLVELLCSGLSLGASSLNTYPEGGGGGIAHFFSAMRLDLFGDPAAQKAHIGSIIDEIRRSEKIAGHDRIFIPGEKEAESRARAMNEGVYLDEATCSYLAELAKEFGLAELKGLCGCAA